jgi:hypothetical protein
MRALATWAVVGGVALIGAAATLDSLRAGRISREPPRPAPVREITVVPCPEEAATASVRGDGGTVGCARVSRANS